MNRIESNSLPCRTLITTQTESGQCDSALLFFCALCLFVFLSFSASLLRPTQVSETNVRPCINSQCSGFVCTDRCYRSLPYWTRLGSARLTERGGDEFMQTGCKLVARFSAAADVDVRQRSCSRRCVFPRYNVKERPFTAIILHVEISMYVVELGLMLMTLDWE